MDEATIREARRVVSSLVTEGEAQLKGGKILAPKDEDLMRLMLTVAQRRVEERPDAPTVENFEPQTTHQSRPKPTTTETPDDENGATL